MAVTTFTEKHNHQSNKCQHKLFLLINNLCIPRFTCLWFPQPYYSHTILIPCNKALSHAGFFKNATPINGEGLLHFPSKPWNWNACFTSALAVKTVYYSCITSPYLKKILHFRLLKLIFQYYITIYIFLCYSVLSSALIHPIIHPKTITEGGKL
jgi:hypothetical protein